LFFAVALVGTFTSENPTRSLFFLDQFARVMIVTYLIIVLTTDRHRFRLVLLVISLSLSFDLAKQGWGDLIYTPGRSNPNPNPFLGDNNGVAMGLLMLMPIFGALIQTSTRGWERFMHRFMAAGTLLRAISTYSRGGFLGAGSLILMIILRSNRKVRSLLAAAALGYVIWAVMPQEFWDRMDTIQVEEGEEREDSAASRLHVWGVAWEMAEAKPMTGVGLNAFNTSFPSYNTDERFEGQQRAAHSVWFGVLGDLGYPGLILFVTNLALAFWACWKVHRISRKRAKLKHLQIYANALMSALVVFSVTGTFLSQHYNEMYWHMIGLTAALHLIAVKEAGIPVQLETRAA
jgi:probable O-glycosylation ligase (exosortase A-associated)